MEVNILCVGDMHIGRSISLPFVSELEENGIKLKDLQPGEAWSLACDKAIEQKADVVALLGDLVDRDDQFYEALGPLEQGIHRLVTAGIQVVGIAGNHDSQVLPRLQKSIPSFKLIGAGGRWEVYNLDEFNLQFVGWSFPQNAVTTNPMTTFHTVEDQLTPNTQTVIGLLHCELDVPKSANAPVYSPSLLNPNVSAWLLGHIHKPSIQSEQFRPVGYLGSLSGLDPTETGAHGPWKLEIENRTISMEHLPVAPLRFEQMDIPVDNIHTIEELQDAQESAIRKYASSLEDGLGDAKVISLRIKLTGRSDCHRELRSANSGELGVGTVRSISQRMWGVEKVDITDVRPNLVLKTDSEGKDPRTVLSRILEDLIEGKGDSVQLIEDAERELQSAASKRGWSSESAKDIDFESTKNFLLRAAWTALEELDAQFTGNDSKREAGA